MSKAVGLIAAVFLMGCGAVRTADHEGADKPAGQDWERIKDCASQAGREFTGMGYSRAEASKIIASFTNHYDQARSICFMIITSTTSSTESILTSNSLSDAFEGKEYGSYISNLSTARGTSARLIDCYVLSAGRTKQLCRSEDEFNELVKPYMESPAAAPAKADAK